MRKWIVLFTVLLFIACKKNKAGGVEINTADPLAKGVNLSNWFNDYSDPGQFTNRFSFSTLQLLKTSGFTYVRIPIGATILFNIANPASLHTTNLAAVDAAVENSIRSGLSVTLNLHPQLNNIDSLLSNDATFPDKLAIYWKTVAAYFKKYPADKLFFEVYNEPHAAAAGITTQTYSWWQQVQGKMITAIREATADHYIIAGGEGWNSINGLLQLIPYSHAKIIYNFHFYDPFLFTHQGASWAGWQPAIDARSVPYPSSPETVAPLITGGNTVLNDALRWYGEQRYSIDSIDKWIKRVYDWGQRHQVKIIANEFGSFMPYAPRQSRLNWIHDVRVTFEKYKIGWAMWECDEGFGLISYSGGNRNNPLTDNQILVALGLK
jgi:endoglucanase